MTDFRYTAVDRAGKQVTGTLTGRDPQDAAARVRDMGYFPIEVAGSSAPTPSGRSAFTISNGKTRANIDSATPVGAAKPSSQRKLGRVEILLFTRELADLIDAGLPIDRSLSVLVDQTDSPGVRFMVEALRQDIRAGKPLSDALTAFPRDFPVLYSNMIRAGEVSGQLPAVMERLADFMEKEQVRRSQIMAALTYPLVLVTIAVSAVSFLLTFVIPKLQSVFKDLGGALPLPTQLLLGMSGLITHYWWAIALIIAGLALAFRAWIATKAGRLAFDAMRLNLPLFGGLNRKITMSRYARTLGTLLAGGVAILDSMEIAGSAVGNAATEAAVTDARDGVRQGETLSSSMAATGGFLPLVVHMSAVGEETGRLGAMLVRTSETMDFEVDNTMRRLTSLVEPLVVLLMGGFVGFVVLSILLPIFEANTLVK